MFKDVLKFRDQPRLHEDRVSAGGIQAVTVPHDKAAVSRSKISNNPQKADGTAMRQMLILYAVNGSELCPARWQTRHRSVSAVSLRSGEGAHAVQVEPRS